jgi:glycosyltransferase involved in cell wall biosynthesis
MEPYKRADVLLEAIPEIRRRVPGAQFVFVGEGSARAGLERAADDLGLSGAVRFVGFVDETVKVELLSGASVVVNTSEKEGWGLTVIEGNAFGVPSVSSNVPGLRDSTRDGETGLLYPFGDASALADAVSRILTDAAFSERLSLAARAWAENFTWEETAADVEALVEAVLQPGASPPQLTSSVFED